MRKGEILKKAAADEGLTVKEMLAYRKIVKPVKHTYGKYGTLVKIYLEEHNPAKLWALMGDLPEYMHDIDKQANEMYEILYSKLSASGQFAKTGEYIKDLQKETEIQKLIEEEIFNELVYVD